MNTKELYLQANRERELTVNEFLDALQNCIRRLKNRYPASLLSGGAEPTSPTSLEENCNLDERYVPALLLGVSAVCTGDAAQEMRFIAEADAAYLALWRNAARARQIGRRGGEA